MSSTLDIPSILATIASLEQQLSVLKAQISGSSGAAKETKVRKERRTNPSAAELPWVVFTKRVSALLASNGYKGTDLAVGNLQFCKVLREENSAGYEALSDQDILARRANWVAPPPKPKEPKEAKESSSSAASVVSGASSAPKEAKKRGPMSEEAKKARKEKMAAKKAAKAQEVSVSNVAASSTVEAPPSPVLTVTASRPGFQKLSLGAKTYWFNKTTGHTYIRNADSSFGDWAGVFDLKTKKLDSEIEEPVVNESDSEEGSDNDSGSD